MKPSNWKTKIDGMNGHRGFTELYDAPSHGTSAEPWVPVLEFSVTASCVAIGQDAYILCLSYLIRKWWLWIRPMIFPRHPMCWGILGWAKKKINHMSVSIAWMSRWKFEDQGLGNRHSCFENEIRTGGRRRSWRRKGERMKRRKRARGERLRR